MGKTSNKLNELSYMVMKEADEKRKEIIIQAESMRKKAIDDSEMKYLKQAYENIQEAVSKLDKTINEDASKTILKSKQTLFSRRDEIINAIFQHVKEKLFEFRHQEGYKSYMKNLIQLGLAQVGQGDIHILVDIEDLNLLKEIRDRASASFQVFESDDQLLGGCLVVNKEKGLMCDFSFASRLAEERATFLEKYRLSIE